MMVVDDATPAGAFDFQQSESYEFYPGTGEKDILERNVINVPVVPLWKRKRSSSSSSSTSSSSSVVDRIRARSSSSRVRARQQQKAGETDDGSPSHAATVRQVQKRLGREDFMKRFRKRILPCLRAFHPDLILISAGFDATKNDVGNAKHMPKFCCGSVRACLHACSTVSSLIRGRDLHIWFVRMDLEPADYAEITASILRVAGVCCKDRVVSVLEGGYGRPLKFSRRGARFSSAAKEAAADAATPNGERPDILDRSSLARVCAAHVGTLAGLTRKYVRSCWSGWKFCNWENAVMF